jgi:hypothetical protein
MTKFRWVLLLICAAATACTRAASEDTATASSTPAAVASGSAAATSAAASTTAAVKAGASSAAPVCPRTGQWALCSVERRLVQSGFVIRRVEGAQARRAGFSVLPAVYTLGRSRLEVFIYPSEATLAADVAKIDTLSAAPRGAKNPWPFFSPTFVRSANLAAVFLTDNPTQAERLTLAITAGAPQP